MQCSVKNFSQAMVAQRQTQQNNTEQMEKCMVRSFFLSTTWNAPEESFNNPKNPTWKGKSADDALFNIGAYYSLLGFEVLPGHYCYDVFHNKHIKEDLESYLKYLKEVFGL